MRGHLKPPTLTEVASPNMYAGSLAYWKCLSRFYMEQMAAVTQE